MSYFSFEIKSKVSNLIYRHMFLWKINPKKLKIWFNLNDRR
jgi:hypothetical protein